MWIKDPKNADIPMPRGITNPSTGFLPDYKSGRARRGWEI